jgi:hypothetical protein
MTTPKDPVTSSSQSSVEIQVERLYCVSRAVQVPIHTPIFTPFCVYTLSCSHPFVFAPNYSHSSIHTPYIQI